MNFAISDTFMSGLLQDRGSGQFLTSGTNDDNDGRDDERTGENEASVCAFSRIVEGPELFSIDDEDELLILEFDDVGADQ